MRVMQTLISAANDTYTNIVDRLNDDLIPENANDVRTALELNGYYCENLLDRAVNLSVINKPASKRKKTNNC